MTLQTPNQLPNSMLSSIPNQMPNIIPRLGVNIDHVATLRQLRGTSYPDILTAAHLAELGGAQQITVYLREDRRHVQEKDVRALRSVLKVSLNLQMVLAPDQIKFACRVLPDWVCFIPKKPMEMNKERKTISAIHQLKKSGIKVSCFIEPSAQAVKCSREFGIDAVEFHSGRYGMVSQKAGVPSTRIQKELDRIKSAAIVARKLGLQCHAGYGFDYENVKSMVELEDENRVPFIEEYNIGHAIICRAVFVGLEVAVREMLSAIQAP